MRLDIGQGQIGSREGVHAIGRAITKLTFSLVAPNQIV